MMFIGSKMLTNIRLVMGFSILLGVVLTTLKKKIASFKLMIII